MGLARAPAAVMVVVHGCGAVARGGASECDLWGKRPLCQQDWETIERVLAAKEAELLQQVPFALTARGSALPRLAIVAQEGSSLEDSHVSGYRPPRGCCMRSYAFPMTFYAGGAQVRANDKGS